MARHSSATPREEKSTRRRRGQERGPGAPLLNLTIDLTSSTLLLNDALDYSLPTVQYLDKLDR